ncbi:MAG: hypothetical protein M0Z79_09950 [Nitrospiraceae bacterium]|nr:hypothetical protein [Nitrospiraceae bacterium]
MGNGVLKVFSAVAVLFFILLSAGTVFSQDIMTLLTEQYALSKDICPAVKHAISERRNTREVVSTAIQMGYSACYVVKCCIEGGGSLEQIIFGAVAAGATPDVVSRCCVEAGARPQTVAEVMQREELLGLGYTPAEGAPPVVIGFPGGDRGGGVVLSPSAF